ncbi:MAG: excalibur calcium-binding domain-containing protein [Candidatus Paceibacterota bacterium]|jgi:hypothetical protein
MYKIKSKFLIIFLLLICPLSVFAHPGRTDANGCHKNRKTGDYHCHAPLNETKGARTKSRVSATTQAKNGEQNDFSACGSKTTCGEMYSCEEAKYFLNICNLTKLDGDKDGIPCEELCK